MKIFMFICLILLVIVLIVFALYLLIGHSLYKSILMRNGKKMRAAEKKYALLKKQDGGEDYFKDYQKLSVLSIDRINLVGFYKDNGCKKLAILVHGYGASHEYMKIYAPIFEKRGYDILAVDLRAHGLSGGDDVTLGRDEKKDILLWIETMLNYKNDYKIVLFGQGLGGSIVMLTCAQNIPKNVVLAVEEGGFDNADRELSYIFSKNNIKFLYKLFFQYTKTSQGLSLSGISPCESLKKVKIPVIFIHGAKDEVVPSEMAYNLASNLPEHRREIYVVEGASHNEVYKINPQKYQEKIIEFLIKYKL